MPWSSIIRRWSCSPNCREKTLASRKYLQKKELALNKKEKELLKKEKVLRHEIKIYNRHKNRRANANLKAANKLNRARKRLLLVLDSKEKLKKSKRKHKVENRIKKLKDGKSKRKGNNGFLCALTEYPMQCLTDFYSKPCSCRPGIVRRGVRPTEPSFLRQICGVPCDCQPAQRQKQPDDIWKMLGMHRCRCEALERNRYGAGDCFLMSLRKTPHVWIRHRWPRLYPHYLDARHHWKNLSTCLLLCAGIIIWTPCIICLHLSKCFCCACCSD